jgi:glycosyltransferase involved in cell wall biosynthesis
MVGLVKVLFMPFFFLPETWNGIDEHLLLLTRFLDRENYHLAVLKQENHGPQTDLLAARAGIELIEAPFGGVESGPSRSNKLARLLRDREFSILHMHSPSAGGQLWPALGARKAGVRAIATYHQVQAWRMPVKTRLLNRITHAFLVDRTTAVSSAVERTLRTNGGLGRVPLQVLANGIDLATPPGAADLPPRRAGEVRFGYCGRLSPEKGLDVLLRGFALIKDSLPQTRLFLAGDGPQRQELERTAARLGLTERVVFLGFRADSRAVISEMDIVVHVPVYEGFGLVMLEAMAASKPLIVNDAPGGMTDLVKDGVNGRIVAAGSADQLAHAMASLAADEAQRTRLGLGGLRICSASYSAPSFAKRVESVYEAVLRPGQRGAEGSPLTGLAR